MLHHKSLLLAAFLLLIPIHCVAQKSLDDIMAGLQSETFDERESATKALREFVEASPKSSQQQLLSLYAEKSIDPETKLRLLDGIKRAARMSEFKKKGGFIGIRIQAFEDRDPQDRTKIKRKGVMVAGVEPGKQGDKAGLLIGDKIYQLDGEELSETRLNLTAEFIKKVQWTSPGETLKLGVERHGKDIKMNVKLGETPEGLVEMLNRPYYYNPEEDFKTWFPKHLDKKLDEIEKRKKPSKADSSAL